MYVDPSFMKYGYMCVCHHSLWPTRGRNMHRFGDWDGSGLRILPALQSARLSVYILSGYVSQQSVNQNLSLLSLYK